MMNDRKAPKALLCVLICFLPFLMGNSFSAENSAVTLIFQNGLNSYTGTVDTFLESERPDQTFDHYDEIRWDFDAATDTAPEISIHGLIRFEDLFGANPGQIPEGALITSAELVLEVINAGDTAILHEAAVYWDGSTNFNTYGGEPGIQSDEYGREAGALIVDAVGTLSIDVTKSVSSWSVAPANNLGWMIKPITSDGAIAYSSEYTTEESLRPKLIVSYKPNILYNQAPNQPNLIQPSNGETDLATSTALEVTVTDPDADGLNVTFFGREVGPGVNDFSIIVLPDTQYYSAYYPSIFFYQTQWIVANKDLLNVQYVVHEGDVVNDPSDLTQWENADAAMSLLEDPVTTTLADGIPYGISPGNHDEGEYYNDYFGVSRFSGRAYFGGEYPANDMENSYMLFSASGIDFIVLNLDYINRAPGILGWADRLLETYRDRQAIVASHEMITSDSTFTPWGMSIFNALKFHPNLFMILSGHNASEFLRTDNFDDRTIYTLLANYQERKPYEENGFLRIMEFSPTNNEIRVSTYSPILDMFETDADSQFTLVYEMESSGPFMLIDSQNVASGDSVSTTWTGLSEWSSYEWYVTVSDGNFTTTSSLWRFDTSQDPIYTPPDCYTLTLSAIGHGSVPSAVPTKSTDCSADREYIAGEEITLTAYPNPGYGVASWSGTVNDPAIELTNVVIMPSQNHAAAVNYRDATAPTGSFVNPPGGGIITKPRALLIVEAADLHSGVQSISFSAFFDGSWHALGAATDGGDSWRYIWPTYNIPDQVVKLQAEIYDQDGNSIPIKLENIILTTTMTFGNGYQPRANSARFETKAQTPINIPQSELLASGKENTYPAGTGYFERRLTLLY